MTGHSLLEVDDLSVKLATTDGEITPVAGVSLRVDSGETLGLVGESGCGKSLTLRALIGLLPRGATVSGEVRLSRDHGEEPLAFDPVRLRGDGIAMIFQEPMTALNPTMRVGDLVAEPLRVRGRGRREAGQKAVALMSEVGIPDASRRARAWPHELSGGLRQRVMIAAALATEPKLLLCDEPTTALDVCVQEQILELLAELRSSRDMSIVLVSHDLAVVATLCDRVAVMYAGNLVETGVTAEVLASPAHPYTRALIGSAPSLSGPRERLLGIPGSPPDPRAFPGGCRFARRCAFRQDDCETAQMRLMPAPFVARRETACIHSNLLAADTTSAA
jgi:oligopeptide/dipeptide ABC transporter ATP-binding protein